MKIKLNFPIEPSGIDKLNGAIEDFKAYLYIETISNLNVSDESKREILKSLIEQLE